MDKFSIITQALRRLGDREYQQESALYNPVEIYFSSVMRECNARHNWSFARRVRVPLEPLHHFHHHHRHHHDHHGKHHFHGRPDEENENMPEMEPERPENAPHHHARYKFPQRHRSMPYRARYGVFLVPDDCMRIIELTDEAGEKADKWELGMDVDRQKRIIYSGFNDNLCLTYTADLMQAGASIPDFAPAYCNGVISLLASRLAPSVLGNEQMAQTLAAEAENYLREAILQDKRQEASNDQHPLYGLIRRDILRGSTYNSEIYYL